MSVRRKVRLVRLDELSIDPRVQRQLRPIRVKRMAADFDFDKFYNKGLRAGRLD